MANSDFTSADYRDAVSRMVMPYGVDRASWLAGIRAGWDAALARLTVSREGLIAEMEAARIEWIGKRTDGRRFVEVCADTAIAFLRGGASATVTDMPKDLSEESLKMWLQMHGGATYVNLTRAVRALVEQKAREAVDATKDATDPYCECNNSGTGGRIHLGFDATASIVARVMGEEAPRG